MTELDVPRFFPPGSLAERIARFVRDQDVEAYLVGGYVRDALLGRSSHDLDFVVIGRALSIARRVANHFGGAFYALDAERDTGRVVFRQGEGGEGQEPFYVDFAAARGGSLAADLALRDFTINAIAVRLDGAQVVDPHGGRADLSAGLLRAVSDRAFRDDPLRTMRAVRLAAELGFEIEPCTEALLRQAVPLLGDVSAERARDELCKLLALPGAAHSLRRLSEFGLLAVLLPEVEALRGVTQPVPHQLDVFEHTLETVRWAEEIIAAVQPGQQSALAALGLSSLSRFPLAAHLAKRTSGERTRAILLKLAALLHDVGKSATRTVEPDGRLRPFDLAQGECLPHEQRGAALASQALTRLRFSVQEMRLVQTVVSRVSRLSGLSRVSRLNGLSRVSRLNGLSGLSGLSRSDQLHQLNRLNRLTHPLTPEDINRRAIYRFFRDIGEAGVDVALLALADHRATWGAALDPERWARLVEVVTLLLTHWYERREQTIAPPKLISGRDLIERFGLEEGPRIGELLEAVREAQVMGQVRTREEALAWVERILAANS